MASNAQLGKIILFSAIAVFFYYFFWVAILPFMILDEGNPIRSLFPPLKYAFIVPTVCGVIFLGGIAVFSFYHIWSFTKAKRA
ncbi:dolichol-phosphate mannose synthase subunit 2 [Drosophila busckii]|uniref:dolichol-phosphate mannose synthase subunit 2 n=1 Tax=Drosophila busckii TaxID=30019 RepID=UPI00083F3495|nr:dolichol-phosphate mannose synthase subunit 2 [Drosophila busckii]